MTTAGGCPAARRAVFSSAAPVSGQADGGKHLAPVTSPIPPPKNPPSMGLMKTGRPAMRPTPATIPSSNSAISPSAGKCGLVHRRQMSVSRKRPGQALPRARTGGSAVEPTVSAKIPNWIYSCIHADHIFTEHCSRAPPPALCSALLPGLFDSRATTGGVAALSLICTWTSPSSRRCVRLSSTWRQTDRIPPPWCGHETRPGRCRGRVGSTLPGRRMKTTPRRAPHSARQRFDFGGGESKRKFGNSHITSHPDILPVAVRQADRTSRPTTGQVAHVTSREQFVIGAGRINAGHAGFARCPGRANPAAAAR